ncbi:MAG: hypothetical protein Q9205_007367, partial [Flavoplaca limonia]
MRCLVLGLGRTGTDCQPSLFPYQFKTPTNTVIAICKALTTLGFNETYHMKTCVRNPAHNEMWLAALEGKYGDGKPFGREEWDELLGNFQAVTDYPAAMFAEEFVEMYPDAKVVLSNHDVDKWFQSVSQTIDWRYNDPILYILSLIDSHNASWSNMFYRMWAIFSRGDFAKH